MAAEQITDLANVRQPAGEGRSPAPQLPRPCRNTLLTRRDRVVLAVLIGVPTAIHLIVRVDPRGRTIVLSFTDWNGIAAIADIRFIGMHNYWEIFTVFESDVFSAAINNGVLVVFLFVGPTAVGILLAYLLDKNLRGGVMYQSVFYMPVVLSLAVVGFIWKSVMYSPSQGVISTVLRRTDPSTRSTGSATRPT